MSTPTEVWNELTDEQKRSAVLVASGTAAMVCGITWLYRWGYGMIALGICFLIRGLLEGQRAGFLRRLP